MLAWSWATYQLAQTDSTTTLPAERQPSTGEAVRVK
jgi:hypothetical protein